MHKVSKIIPAIVLASIFTCFFLLPVVTQAEDTTQTTISAPTNPATPDSTTSQDATTPPTYTGPRAVLYMTASQNALKSLRAHIQAMDIVAPQTYAATPAGKLLGSPNPEILRIASDAKASVMPLVVNQAFDQDKVHLFLKDPAAQERLVNALIVEARAKNYIGYQYDFEHMLAADRDGYTAFVQMSAPLFHAVGLQLSIALAPQHSEDQRDYGGGSWNNWTGAFDYKALGAAADFVSVMAYDDSRSVGPVASLPWVNEVLQYTLARVPAEKISLGVPFYAWVWRDKTGKKEYSRGYPALAPILARKAYVKQGWSENLGVSYVTYVNQNKKKYTAWYEDQKSFSRKLSLVTKYKLHGFSAWALGQEDPKIWNTIDIAMRAPDDGLALR